ncbi:cytochrome c [Deinococcus humi]|uniref:Cytochrome c domain-containing protein n=2 Tax=Deinococcus TaxID=1298 RepID=A0A7W8NHW6_9DEIO|nr:cytochrome c [Deinococcus humi]MBB5364442.1 hypothetical protein [Deinococcus humi]GGO33085.1 hypothetical protein GCM10008949_31780 [Deinococcus humi]
MKYPELMGLLMPLAVLAVVVPVVTLSVRNNSVPAATATTGATPATAPVSAPAPAPSPAQAAPAAQAAANPKSAAVSASPETASGSAETARPQTSTAQTATAQTTSSQTTQPQNTMAQYAEQMRGVIDQAASGAYTTDASYAIGPIPQDTPALVEGKDVELVRSNCSVCHATTLITSQPPLPSEVWHAEVYKMKEKYGATFISDENADRIVTYLSAHYTPETRKAESSTAPDRTSP